MELEGLGRILVLALGLGFLHALDADHVIAVSGLACAKPGSRSSIGFCLRWAFGHGLTLLAIGSAVLLLGIALPADLSHVAERLVGVVLIAIGGWVLWDLLRTGPHLHYHSHHGLPRHAHWHHHPAQEQGPVVHTCATHEHGHGAVMVGILHGAAGSAPLLALLPIGTHGAPWLGIAYLLVFGFGVLVAMLLCGGLLGAVFEQLRLTVGRQLSAVRGAVGILSVGTGLFWLVR